MAVVPNGYSMTTGEHSTFYIEASLEILKIVVWAEFTFGKY